jgi:hypothetical protein
MQQNYCKTTTIKVCLKKYIEKNIILCTVHISSLLKYIHWNLKSTIKFNARNLIMSCRKINNINE